MASSDLSLVSEEATSGKQADMMTMIQERDRPPSIASTTESKREIPPTRVDSVTLEWVGRHKYVRSSTWLYGYEHPVTQIGVTRLKHDDARRSHFMAHTLGLIRDLATKIETRLAADKEEYNISGHIGDDPLSEAHAEFLKNDEGIASHGEGSEKPLQERDLWILSANLMGLLTTAIPSISEVDGVTQEDN